MSLHALAYGPDDACIVSIDGAELLAYDAQSEAPRWVQAFAKPLVGVVTTEPAALPGCQPATPWRSQSGARAIAAIDADGALHVVDGAMGQPLGELGPFGKPHAAAASIPTSAFALAAGERVLLWKGGEATELAIQASALAFSPDGLILAIGTANGDVFTVDVAVAKPALPAGAKPAFRVAHAVADIAAHPDGTFVVATPRGLQAFGKAVPALARHVGKRVAFDATGQRLAVQASDRSVVVSEWPSLVVVSRIEYTERTVRGIAFGDASWLGLGLEHGDANKVDLETSAVHRTDPHPGRTHRTWTMTVEGKKERLARQAEVLREAESATKEGASRFGPRLGIGAVISFAVIGLRLCRLASPSPSYPSYTYTPPTIAAKEACDRACAIARIEKVRVGCAKSSVPCADDAIAANAAVLEGDCAGARSHLATIDQKLKVHESTRTTPPDGLKMLDEAILGSDRLLASLGLNDACHAGLVTAPAKALHPYLVAMKAPSYQPTIEAVPESGALETPQDLYVAPDGTIFVATQRGRSCIVHRRSPKREWTVSHEATPCEEATLGGRTASDVWLTASAGLVHYDGRSWSSVPSPGTHPAPVAFAGTDALTVGVEDDVSRIYRRTGTGWTEEKSAPEASAVKSGAGAVLAVDGSQRHLLRRSAAGVWEPFPAGPASDAGEPPNLGTINAFWPSATGTVVVAYDTGVFRTTNGGGSWKEDLIDAVPHHLWGRSGTDIFGVSHAAVVHFDGRTWKKVLDVHGGVAIGGTAGEVFLLRAGEDDP